jgi:hypothetical protein
LDLVKPIIYLGIILVFKEEKTILSMEIILLLEVVLHIHLLDPIMQSMVVKKIVSQEVIVGLVVEVIKLSMGIIVE